MKTVEIRYVDYEIPEDVFNWLASRDCFIGNPEAPGLNPDHLWTTEEVEVLMSQELPE